jgi:hypothetical protein
MVTWQGICIHRPLLAEFMSFEVPLGECRASFSGRFGFMRRLSTFFGACLCAFLTLVPALALPAKTLSGHLPRPVQRIAPAASLEATNELTLSLGLPLRDPVGLAKLLDDIYDPASARYHRYLTGAEFTARFGPLEADYQRLIAYALDNGFKITSLHPNRTLLGVSGSVRNVQQALGVKMRLYKHPREDRYFFSADTEPTVKTELPIQHISGLNDFVQAHPMNLRPATIPLGASTQPRRGTGANGTYLGNDFRKAYVPGTTLTGTGQRIGLFELNGYYTSDINAYLKLASLPAVPLQNVLIDGFTGSAGGRRPGSPNEEVALDIEVAASMAPGVDAIMVYEGAPTATIATINHILNRMATDNAASQLSCSWGFDIDINTEQIFKQFAAQGQSFFLASGDDGAFSGVVVQPSDSPFVTVVGGTDLVTDNSQRWVSESAWPFTGGGISTVFSLPSWQQGIDMSANLGSTSMRNLPDVALVADNVLIIADRGLTQPVSGTSISAPLWAGLMALINQQAAANAQPPVGFLNPTLYTLARSAAYSTAFHDITKGNNTNDVSLDRYFATAGYDLCTGWGTPNGTNFINALLNLPGTPLRVDSPLGFTANGRVGGPFNVTSQTYGLTNVGDSPLSWDVINPAAWLNVSLPAGTLAPGDSTGVTISLTNTAALLLGDFSATVTFRNLTGNSAQTREFSVHAGNAGFEAGDLSVWTFRGNRGLNYADSLDSDQFLGQSGLPGVPDSSFVHSGIYGAFLGQATTPATLSQTLPTVPGQQYVVSYWFSNPAEGAPNEFTVSWNGIALSDQSDIPITPWTQYQFEVTADSASSVLTFTFENDQAAFALDDVCVQAKVIPPPSSATVAVSTDGAQLQLSWNTVPGLEYQLQYTTSLNAPNWTPLGDVLTVSDVVTLFSDPLDPSQPMRFYRLVQL